MSKNILVVDDDPEVRELLRITLTSQRGFNVTVAENGQDGLDMMAELKPDLVIVDIHMPGLNGYQFVVRARKENEIKHIPVIVITSLTQDSRKTDEEWRSSMGVEAFLSKPFQPLDMLNKIDELLGLKPRQGAQ